MLTTDSPKLTVDEAVKFLVSRGYPMTRPTLLKLGRDGKGPSAIRWGNRNLYDAANLLAFAEGRAKPAAGK